CRIDDVAALQNQLGANAGDRIGYLRAHASLIGRLVASTLQRTLQKGRAVELVRGGLVGHVHDVDREPAGETVVRQVRREVFGVRLGVGAPQAILLGRVAGGVGERTRAPP